MSVDEVTARIGQIQSQLSLLTPTVSAGSAFASQLSAAGAAYTRGTTALSSPGAPTGSPTGEQVVADARKYLGLPYVWGGSSPADGGMDCSGLVQHVYGELGISLPRVAADQARAGQPVASLAEAQPGDLIAWDEGVGGPGADHIAIYAGNGKMIEAPHTGAVIRYVDVPSTPDYIRRILPTSSVPSTSLPSTALPPNTSAVPIYAPSGALVSPGSSPGSSGTSSLADPVDPRRVSSSVPFAGLFESAGARYGVSPVLLAAVAKQESGFNPRATSGAGAQGLMQLMPGTASGLGVSDPFQPAQAVDGAARLLHGLLARFGQVDLALAGYNAGPGAVMRYQGVPPYPETQGYVRSVMAMAGLS